MIPVDVDPEKFKVSFEGTRTVISVNVGPFPIKSIFST